MKAAFLFSGQLRGFPFCVDAFKQYLFSSFEEYDTFFYLPDTDSKTLFDCWSPTAATLENEQIHSDIPGFQHNICRSEKRSETNNYVPRAHMQHYYLQWYGVKRVFELLKAYSKVNNATYDVVFRIRPDILFYDKFDYKYFDGIQLPSFNGSGGLYDRLAFGSYENIKKYCGLYDGIMGGLYNNMAYTGNSESKLRQHIETNNIPVKTIQMSFYHSINKDGTYDKNGTY